MLKEKVALVTGGAQGIGFEIARKFISQGAFVFILDINEEVLNKAKEELGENCAALKCDVSNFKEAEKCVKTALDKKGKINILVNNAGITRDNLIMRMTEEEWNQVININLNGTFNCLKAVSRIMQKQREGKIINISSVVGLMGNIGQVNYSASKAGVIGLTKSAAKELARRNVQINAVAPGFIKTAMTDKIPEAEMSKLENLIPMRRLGMPEDVANVCLFLAGAMSDYITGQVITVDGGMVM